MHFYPKRCEGIKKKKYLYSVWNTTDNVWVAKKDTKRSSNTLLHLVSFSATHTLLVLFPLIFWRKTANLSNLTEV